MYVEGCQVLGGRDDIDAVCVERLNIDLIVVAIHNISGPAFREILSVCENSQARIKVIPDLFELVRNPGSKMPLRDIQPEDLLGRKVVTRHEAVDLSPVTDKVILVTGAAGSIGSELSHQIMDYDPIKVILLDNNESGLHDLIIVPATSVPAHRYCPGPGRHHRRGLGADHVQDSPTADRLSCGGLQACAHAAVLSSGSAAREYQRHDEPGLRWRSIMMSSASCWFRPTKP